MSKRQLTVYMKPEDYEALQVASKKEGVTMSATVNQLIKKYIKRSK